MSDKITNIADRRHSQNAYSRTNKPIESEAEALGIAGEMAFANLIGINHTPKSSSPTRGYQFDLGNNKHIKITTSRTPGNLFVKEGKVLADVYVLAGCDGDPVMENIYFVGWTHKGEILKAPVITPSGRGNYIQPAHKIGRDGLMDMKYLMHALDLNPDHIHRFPLVRNGGYEVAPHSRPPVRSGDFAPQPMKKFRG